MSGQIPNPLKRVFAVFDKELRDALRDRRSLGSALAFAVFGPLFLAMILGALAKSRQSDGPLALPVVGADNAPRLVAFLEQQGAELVDPPADPAQAIRDGESDFVLVISDGYADDWSALRPATVQLLHDSSRSSGAGQLRKLRGWLESWSQRAAQHRLLLRGVEPSITNALAIERLDFASAKAQAARILGSMPVFFLLATFVCAMNVAIDTTAGERERGSLESLLTHAIPTRQLATGKWMAAVVLDILGLAVMLMLSIAVLRPERFEGLGVTVQFGRQEALAVFLVLLPLTLMAPALQMVMAIFAKSFKEAQTYLSLMIFVPMIPGFLLMTEVFDIAPWMHGVPVLAQQVQILDLMRGEAITTPQLLGGALATVATAALLVTLVGHLLGRERIVLAR